MLLHDRGVDLGRKDLHVLWTAAGTLNVDRVAAEVIQVLERAGIPSILLKGRSFAVLLYPEGGRRYGDVDVLIRFQDLPGAISLLRSHSFHLSQEGFRPSERSERETRLVRKGRLGVEVVELHTDLQLPPDSDRTWRALSARTERLRIGAVDVHILDAPARLMHVALHAAQHGVASDRPLTARTREDLRRALSAFDVGAWRQACSIAREIGVEEAFAFGLRLDGQGRRVADELKLTTTAPPAWMFNAGRPTPEGSYRLLLFWSSPGWRDRWVVLRDVLAPSRARACHLSGVSRDVRGLKLAGVYARYWVRLMSTVIPAMYFAARTRLRGLRQARPATPDRIEITRRIRGREGE